MTVIYLLIGEAVAQQNNSKNINNKYAFSHNKLYSVTVLIFNENPSL